jgi:hypothetical protein
VLYGQLSEKADVFSFGVLLLEIVSGKRNKDPSAREDEVYLPNRVSLFLRAMDCHLKICKLLLLTLQRLRVSSKLMGENEPCLGHVISNCRTFVPTIWTLANPHHSNCRQLCVFL